MKPDLHIPSRVVTILASRDYDAIEKTAPVGFDVGVNGSKAGEVIPAAAELRPA
jgi:hypothetical protein